MSFNNVRMPRSKRNLLIITCGLLLIRCGQENQCRNHPNITSVKVEVSVDRLEQQLFELQTTAEVLSFFDQYPVFTYHFIDSYEYPNDTILAKRTLQLIADPHIKDTLYSETLETFGDLDELANQFIQSFKLTKYYYPSFEAPKIQTAITGFYKDLFLSDSLIIIGIDHYLGRQGTYKPRDIPQYILDRYEPENVVPMVMYFLSNRFNRVDFSQGTMLSEMIDFGKAYYFTQQVVPCATDAQIVGYSDEVLIDVRANQEIIWANFIENELLYETDHQIKNKFIGERPKIPEIGEKCPGRIAAWLGYEIVKSFMKENSEITLPQLMAETDAAKIFRLSKYKPRNQ